MSLAAAAVAAAAAVVVAACAVAPQPASAMFFKMDQGKERCFLEEVPKDMLMLGRFKVTSTTAVGGAMQVAANYAALADVQVTAVIYNPDGAEVFRREQQGAEGRFALTSQTGGEHKICVSTQKASWFAGQHLNFHLSIDSGTGAQDYSELAQREHLSQMDVDVRRINDRIRDIRQEQNYQQKREMAFRDTSESTVARVAWWSVIQCVILVATGLWQVTTLKSFFSHKKLI